jgi:hypothetical protein
MKVKYSILAATLVSLAGSASFAQEFKAGNMFVLSRGNNKIFEFDSADAEVRSATVPADASFPFVSAFGPNGHLYMASDITDRLVELDTAGKLVQSGGTGAGIDRAQSLALTQSGRILVSSGSTHSIDDGRAALRLRPGPVHRQDHVDKTAQVGFFAGICFQ